jgi:SAM-dependent methyltransferase
LPVVSHISYPLIYESKLTLNEYEHDLRPRRGACVRLSAMSFTDFVLSQLPSPARVLEVGCGAGRLAYALAAAGYDVLAIDPVAPEGPLFRRATLAELDDPGLFDAVVAQRSLHHFHDLDAALERIHALLRPGGMLVVDEFAWDRLDETTGEWYDGQRRMLLAAGRDPKGGGAAEWAAEHEGLHGFDALHNALVARFRERGFSWEPYLYQLLGGVASEELERTLIDMSAIQPLGFRWVGTASRGRRRFPRA